MILNFIFIKGNYCGNNILDEIGIICGEKCGYIKNDADNNMFFGMDYAGKRIFVSEVSC